MMSTKHFFKISLFALGICLLTTQSQSAVLTTEINKATELNDAYTKSFQYEKVGDFSNAINSMLLVQKNRPDDYTLNLRLGYLYLSSYKYANAISFYQKAHKAAPKAIPPQLGLMRIMNIQGKYAESETAGYQILQSDIYNYYGNLYLAYALRMSKKWDIALQVNLKMLAAYPSDKLFLLEYSLLSVAQKNTKAARQALNYLLMLDPENITAKETLSTLSKQPMVKQ